jgi:Sulfotransferase family
MKNLEAHVKFNTHSRNAVLPLRFLHIPKTAGGTFEQILMRQYRGKVFFSFYNESRADTERFQALTQKERQNIALFYGHVPITTGIREADEATIITFLRDPVARVKSFCQHVYEGKSSHLLQSFPPERFCLDEFLDSGDWELYNLQTKMLINRGRAGLPDLIDRLSASEAFERARKNLSEKIACFGLQEYFDESLVLFAAKFGWRTLYYDSVNRPNPARKLEFQEHHIKRIIELNAVDIELYKFAKEKFLNQISKKDFDAERLQKLRLAQRQRARWTEFRKKLGYSLQPF